MNGLIWRRLVWNDTLHVLQLPTYFVDVFVILHVILRHFLGVKQCLHPIAIPTSHHNAYFAQFDWRRKAVFTSINSMTMNLGTFSFHWLQTWTILLTKKWDCNDKVVYLFGPHFDLYQSLNRLPIWNSQNCNMFPLAFVAGWLQGHRWGFIGRNYVVWPTFFLMNVFIALKGSHFWFYNCNYKEWINTLVDFIDALSPANHSLT